MAKKSKAQKEAAYVAIEDHFNIQYGSSEKLGGWQNMCLDVGVEAGQSITQCKKHLKGVHVNIVDFVAARQAGQQAYRFPSRSALRNYICNTGKWFPLKRAKKDTFLKAFLIHVY